MPKRRIAAIAVMISGFAGMMALIFVMAMQVGQAEHNAKRGRGYRAPVAVMALVPVAIGCMFAGIILYSKSKNAKS